jgi:hypothetical protein
VNLSPPSSALASTERDYITVAQKTAIKFSAAMNLNSQQGSLFWYFMLLLHGLAFVPAVSSFSLFDILAFFCLMTDNKLLNAGDKRE